MNSTGPILVSLVAATGVTYTADIAKREALTIRPLIGMFALGIGLFGVALMSDDIAKAIALLVLVTSVVLNGGEVFRTVSRLVG